MSSEILSVLEYMEKEKGIDRKDMIGAISLAIKTAASKGVNAGQELKVEIDPKTGGLHAWMLLNVVDSISDPTTEIHIEKARLIDKEMNLGDVFEKPIDPAFLGRIAAQTARQAIMQQVRQFEKERIFDDYKDSIGDVVSGIVRRRERSDLIIDLGKAEALLPAREKVHGEDYAPGERIRCLLLAIEQTNRGPELILSRAHSKFIRRLMELEVTEITDGTVVIKALAREPGYRTKIAVMSKDKKVDPVGACVGARGARVKSIVRELGGEKIDIIRYFEDPKEMLAEALKPAVPLNVEIDERNKRIHFEVADRDLSVAIGRRGQNARLTSRLMGWRLDISKEKIAGGFEDRKERAIAGLNQIPGISDELANRLVAVGLISPETFTGVEASDLLDAGFTQEEADEVLTKVKEFLSQ
ncbi:MAG: transcription termination factor NusA [Verrucomicrobia bacterium]|nr:transcription termination factor NusA [Verrucomicrobiota bacterium]MDA1067150.1 transcription termination factor NusA [Verrucomicrobiota bacterium]